MNLQVGTYQLDAGACNIIARFVTLRNRGGIPYATRQALDVEGFLTVAGQADCTQKMNALASALGTPYRDIIFLQDSGAASATLLLNANSISGVIVTRGPEFPENKGGEYSVYRKFSFTAEAEYPLAGTQGKLMSFTEQLIFSGGGPRRVWLESVNTLPQRQTPYLATVYRVIQRGEAVGYRQYPNVPAAIWPAYLIENPEYEQTSPELMGKGYQGYHVRWEYKFASDRILLGVPHLWVP